MFVDVSIVEGGVEGLATAKTLGNKLSYVLIEVQNYLGGRVHTINTAPNVTVDLGGQYVQREKNSLYKIYDELNLLFPDDDEDEDSIVVTINGKHLDSELLEKARDFWERAIDKAEDQWISKPIVIVDIVSPRFNRANWELFHPNRNDENCLSNTFGFKLN